MSSADKWSTIFSYASDYVISFSLIVVAEIIGHMTPQAQPFFIDNPSLMYPFKDPETFSNGDVVLLCAIVPVIVIFLTSFLLPKRSWSRKWWDSQCGLLGLVIAFAINMFITNSLKTVVGKPRPDILARCNPTGQIARFKLATIANCLQTDQGFLYEGFRSFPSGHSSNALTGMTFLSLYLAGQLQAFDQRGHSWKLFVVFAPLLLGFIIAGSRVNDARHHAFDVTVGSLLGIVVGSLVFRQFFPAPWDSKQQGRAYAPRLVRFNPLFMFASGTSLYVDLESQPVDDRFFTEDLRWKIDDIPS
ncbi:hypothetical protein CANCADRAFT_123238 [Tortispora caseinolytica NRRL Y-17796]|uniref:Phosphatidic acid phosphatase type 2/haloperoxidase domain-containing protein n=1 Tax=Tortispora caseinolytica NRRL Y-17796 TaxID=767744 RepID=A0A1E4TI04_9ASCO|nr:hypothetical protein CANCADRAFT_123238 [Tortispora caseinolytica NRRL Y-17796]